jgi:hypothetical protein
MRLEGDFALEGDAVNLQNTANLDVVPHRKAKASHLALYLEDPSFLDDKKDSVFHFTLQLTPSGSLQVKFQPKVAEKLSEVEKNIKKRQNEEFRRLKEKYKKELEQAKRDEARAKQDNEEAKLKADQAEFKRKSDERVSKGLSPLPEDKSLVARAKAVAAANEKLANEEAKAKEAEKKENEKTALKTGPAGAPLEKGAGAKK